MNLIFDLMIVCNESLHFDTCLSDLGFHSRLQGHMKVKTSVSVISQSSRLCFIEFGMLLRLLSRSVDDLDFYFIFSI